MMPAIDAMYRYTRTRFRGAHSSPPRAPLVAALDLGDLLQAHADLADRLHDAGRLDAVLRVVGDLEVPPPLGLVDRPVHRRRPPVRVHDDPALEVPRGAADHLDERALRAEVALLVGVQDRHERDLGKVDALPQEVHADDDVVHAEPEVPQDLDALDGLDLGVEVVHLDAHLAQ